MNPKLFEILENDILVKMLLGSNPLRVYPWSRAPQNSRKPYAVYGLYNGSPENYLNQVPDIDNKSTQIDIYGEDPDSVEKTAVAVRNALEPHAHMTSFSTIDRDAETDFYGFRLEFDFWETR